MEFKSDDVKRIAKLARIALNEHEAVTLAAEMGSIFALIEVLQSVDTEGVEPMSHGQDVVLRLREDRVTEIDQHALFQASAPQVEAGLYLVPKVIE